MRRPSLDVLRGGDVALLLLVEWVLPSSAYAWLRHSPWNGIRVADVVFPLFLYLVGASAAVGRPRPWQRQIRRALTLIVLGFLFNAWGDSGADLARLRVPGVLQMIGVAGLLGGAVVVACRHRVERVGAVAFGLVAVHAALLSHLPLDCGTGRLDQGCSASWQVDRHLFGLAHVYHQGQFGHDPEGVLNVVFGATALVLFGWVTGRLLDAPKRAALVAVATAAVGLLATLVYPPMKRLWTPSFTLLMAAGSIAALVTLALAVDGGARRRPQPVRWSLTALGRNALFVYVAQHVVLAMLEATSTGDHSLADALHDRVGSLLGVALLAVVVGTAVAAIMRAFDWYVTV